MPKRSATLTDSRKNEILDSCAKLYETMSFKEITMKDIGNATSFTRTSIYNYFQTKEEIFLALLAREYRAWNRELVALSKEKEILTRDELAVLLAETLSRRELMLKLLSVNLFDMEENSSIKRLVELKREWKEAARLVSGCLQKVRPAVTASAERIFVSAFFPFMHGIYSYTSPTPKQRQAMQQAGVSVEPLTVYALVYRTAKQFLAAL